MTDESDPEANQPVFHGSPTSGPSSSAKDASRNAKLAAGVAFGVGSAALVAALLYARRAKSMASPKPRAVEPSD